MNEEAIKFVRELERIDSIKYGPLQECCNMYLSFCACHTKTKEERENRFENWKATQEA